MSKLRASDGSFTVTCILISFLAFWQFEKLGRDIYLARNMKNTKKKFYDFFYFGPKNMLKNISSF